MVAANAPKPEAKQDQGPSEVKAPEEAPQPVAKKSAPTHAAPSEYKDLPLGKDGRPASIDNPAVPKKGK